jgi:hypothetical protein
MERRASFDESDAQRDMKQRLPVVERKLPRAGANALRNEKCLLRTCALQNDHKLIPALTDGIVCDAHVDLDAGGKLAQHLILHQMPVGIIDGLKIVHVDEQQRRPVPIRRVRRVLSRRYCLL